jgi:ATP-dependent DNA helicase RecQ
LYRKKSDQNQQSLEKTNLRSLKKRAATIDELAIMFISSKEALQEHLIFLLELGKIKMLDFRTYTIK